MQRCLSRLSASGQGDAAGTPPVRVPAAHDVRCMWLIAGGACCAGWSESVQVSVECVW